MAGEWKVTNGGTHTPEYRVWHSMRQRCNNPKNVRYYRYGGRGISVCEHWNDFANFSADMGKRPSARHSIDRIDNDGNYEIGNCRWATRSEQQRNKGEYPKDHHLPCGDNHWTKRNKSLAKAIARQNIKNAHKSGEQNGNAKLTRAKVVEMRAFRATNPSIDMVDLGRAFGVGRETARKVIRGMAWQS